MLSMFETDEEIEEEEQRKFGRRNSVKVEDYPFELDDGNHSPTTQRNRVLSSLTVLHVDTSEDEDGETDETCACGRTALFGAPGDDLPLLSAPITDRYRVSHEIVGEGESGRVMACYRISDGAKFALKVLRDCAKARCEAELHYLTHEHPNIVSIIDMYENTFDGVKCLLIVVEFLEGGDLLSQFEAQGSRPYTEKKVGEIVRQIGAAVEYLHDLNIAHRDIKLENVLCSSKDDGCVYKLADFGFAKRPEKNTMMQSPCCTPFYAPPEVIGHKSYGLACDLWSLGVAMYILLSGYPPFYSMKGAQTSPGMFSRISQGYYCFPHAEWDIISDATKTVVRSLLKTTPMERLTIQELLHSKLVEEACQDNCPVKITTSNDSGTVDVDVEDAEEALEELPTAGLLLKPPIRAQAKIFRLHSIQEERIRVKDSTTSSDEEMSSPPSRHIVRTKTLNIPCVALN